MSWGHKSASTAADQEYYLMNVLTPLAVAVGTMLKERKETVAVSESSTGGLVAAALLSAPGASAYFMGGAVTYTHSARGVFLGIDLADHPGMRSSSEPYALIAAEAARSRLKSTWGLSETGAAGPTGNRYGDAAGHSCFAITGPIERAITIETCSVEREANMWAFSRECLRFFEKALHEVRRA
jgi:nicotinamide-nucleotide amidase